MQPDEALAIARLRQWAVDRMALRSARTVDYRREGWQQRNDRRFDARLVRVLDFDRALSTLDGEEQAALILTHRDHEAIDAVARALACSARKVSYTLIAARRKLAAELDRLNLL